MDIPSLDCCRNRAGSALCLEPVSIVAFNTGFSFQLQNPGADGIMFVLQGQGPKAFGEYGINLGFGGEISRIQKSVGIKFDLYNNAGEGSKSTGLFVMGSTPTMPAAVLTSTDIDLHSGHIFAAPCLRWILTPRGSKRYSDRGRLQPDLQVDILLSLEVLLPS